jgi:mRNA interferase RelE/StbE
VKYRIALTGRAKRQISDIKDVAQMREIQSRIDDLADNPELGKPLRRELTGYYSIRAGRQRYRIIYTIAEGRLIVTVVMIGQRREGDFDDVYNQMERIVRRGGNGNGKPV